MLSSAAHNKLHRDSYLKQHCISKTPRPHPPDNLQIGEQMRFAAWFHALAPELAAQLRAPVGTVQAAMRAVVPFHGIGTADAAPQQRFQLQFRHDCR